MPEDGHMTISREKVLAAICSVRVQVDGDARMYADEDGTLPIYTPDEAEAGLLADAVLAALQEEPPEVEYQYQVFDTTRSRKVMDVLDGDLPSVQQDMNKYTPDGWVIRRRVVGPWEDVQ